MNAERKPISNHKDAVSDPANRFIIENSAIHKLIAEKLTEYDTLLMHGSALCMDGNGYLFTAPSGTGKSTHARLWRQVFGDRVWMIDDDKPLLQIKESEVIVWGSPWNGKHRLGRNASAPLKAVISLTRDSTNHIEPLETADAFEVIMRQVYRSDRPITMLKILELEKCLLRLVRFYKLGCNMEPDAVRTAWKELRSK